MFRLPVAVSWLCEVGFRLAFDTTRGCRDTTLAGARAEVGTPDVTVSRAGAVSTVVAGCPGLGDDTASLVEPEIRALWPEFADTVRRVCMGMPCCTEFAVCRRACPGASRADPVSSAVVPCTELVIRAELAMIVPCGALEVAVCVEPVVSRVVIWPVRCVDTVSRVGEVSTAVEAGFAA